MRTFILTCIALLFMGHVNAQSTADSELAEMLNSGDMLRLNTRYPQIKDSLQVPMLARLAETNLYIHFNQLEKAEKACEKFPKAEKAIADYQEALADPEVDAVYVLTPNYSHYRITMDALRAGKHVFCEKPITVNYPYSMEMAEEAVKQKKVLNIGVCNRYNKSVETLAQYVKEGKFGKIYHICCSFRSYRSIPGLGGAFTTKAQAGGGVLIDWGVHFLDLILYILGGAKVKSVTGEAYSEMAKDMKTYKDVKGIKTKPRTAQNFCPISCVPWLSFTSLSYDTFTENKMLLPIIAFGKYHSHHSKTTLPFSIFVNHAVADGYHTCKLIQQIQDMADMPNWLETQKHTIFE